MNISSISDIIIVGVGGTGSWLVSPLFRLLAHNESFNGRIIIIDGDHYTTNNSNRQEFASVLSSYNKSDAQAALMIKRYPTLKHRVVPISEYIGQDNISNIIAENSVIFNCVDNHVARHLVDKYIDTLHNAIHICGGNELHSGQVQYHVRENNQNLTPPITKAYPEIATIQDGDRSTMSCEELLSINGGEQILITNLMSATLMLCFFNSLITHGVKFNYYPCDRVEFDTLSVSMIQLGKQELKL